MFNAAALDGLFEQPGTFFLYTIARRMGFSYSAVSCWVSAVARRVTTDPRFSERLARLADVRVKS